MARLAHYGGVSPGEFGGMLHVDSLRLAAALMEVFEHRLLLEQRARIEG